MKDGRLVPLSAGFVVDPVNQILKKVAAIPLK
jgi:hypothetical protein